MMYQKVLCHRARGQDVGVRVQHQGESLGQAELGGQPVGLGGVVPSALVVFVFVVVVFVLIGLTGLPAAHGALISFWCTIFGICFCWTLLPASTAL